MRRGKLQPFALAMGAFAITIAALSGCETRLPDQDSYAGQLYVKRCGNCHQPYNPRSMTPAMWQTQVPMMEVKMRAAGLRALSPAERQTILDYLLANAGRQ